MAKQRIAPAVPKVEQPEGRVFHETNASFEIRQTRFDLAARAVWAERCEQFEKWGDQKCSPEVWMAILMEEVGEAAQAVLEDRFGGRHAGTFKNEIVQVAAVAVAIIEYLDRLGYDDSSDRTEWVKKLKTQLG